MKKDNVDIVKSILSVDYYIKSNKERDKLKRVSELEAVKLQLKKSLDKDYIKNMVKSLQEASKEIKVQIEFYNSLL
jgi:predicted lipase